MKVVVFGANGMLGRYVSTYLKKEGHEVKEVTRAQFDVSDFNSYKDLDTIIHGAEAVINCAGTIKPVANSQPKETTFMVNSIFPNYLARICAEDLIKCFHITTDCVYDGANGNYDERLDPNMLDDYGFSKSIGDYASHFCTVIRTSIIGEELENGRSLLEWAKSQKDKEVNGFTNHYWNGVTCLQLAKVLNEVIEIEPTVGTFHLHSDTVTKAELLQLISDSFKLNLTVNEVEAPSPCNRTLSSIYSNELEIPPLKQQIDELVGFYE